MHLEHRGVVEIHRFIAYVQHDVIQWSNRGMAMFLDPEGGDARVDRYVPPPPPPAPAPPPKVSTFQGQVNADTTQYQRDSSALGAARGNLATALRNAAQNNYGSVATAKNGPGGASTAVATLTSQVTALQGRVTADQRALATAKAHLAAAKAAQSAATHYKPKPLPVTVSNRRRSM